LTLPEGRYLFTTSTHEHLKIIARCNVQLFQCKPSSKRLIPGANVFTPFYLSPRRFRMYCQFCIYTPARP
jgi:hypothetical protein